MLLGTVYSRPTVYGTMTVTLVLSRVKCCTNALVSAAEKHLCNIFVSDRGTAILQRVRVCVRGSPNSALMNVLTSHQYVGPRGVREGLFLFPFPPIHIKPFPFPFPPIPMIKTYSHSHFSPIPLFTIPIPITVMKFLEISKAKKCIIGHIQNIKTYINRSHRHYVT